MAGGGWAEAPYVFIPLPSCPHCGSYQRPITIRSESGGDGSTTRKSVCRHCGGRFLLVLEPAVPGVGKSMPTTRYDTGDDEIP